MYKSTKDEHNGVKTGKFQNDKYPTGVKPKEMCRFLEDECNKFKINKCKYDHNVDEYGSQKIK